MILIDSFILQELQQAARQWHAVLHPAGDIVAALPRRQAALQLAQQQAGRQRRMHACWAGWRH